MSDEQKRKKKPKRDATEIEQLVSRLNQETHEVYRATGSEPSEDYVREILKAVVDEVWPMYIQVEFRKKLGLAGTAPPASEEEED